MNVPTTWIYRLFQGCRRWEVASWCRSHPFPLTRAWVPGEVGWGYFGWVFGQSINYASGGSLNSRCWTLRAYYWVSKIEKPFLDWSSPSPSPSPPSIPTPSSASPAPPPSSEHTPWFMQRRSSYCYWSFPQPSSRSHSAVEEKSGNAGCTSSPSWTASWADGVEIHQIPHWFPQHCSSVPLWACWCHRGRPALCCCWWSRCSSPYRWE